MLVALGVELDDVVLPAVDAERRRRATMPSPGQRGRTTTGTATGMRRRRRRARPYCSRVDRRRRMPASRAPSSPTRTADTPAARSRRARVQRVPRRRIPRASAHRAAGRGTEPSTREIALAPELLTDGDPARNLALAIRTPVTICRRGDLPMLASDLASAPALCPRPHRPPLRRRRAARPIAAPADAVAGSRGVRAPADQPPPRDAPPRAPGLPRPSDGRLAPAGRPDARPVAAGDAGPLGRARATRGSISSSASRRPSFPSGSTRARR